MICYLHKQQTSVCQHYAEECRIFDLLFKCKVVFLKNLMNRKWSQQHHLDNLFRIKNVNWEKLFWNHNSVDQLWTTMLHTGRLFQLLTCFSPTSPSLIIQCSIIKTSTFVFLFFLLCYHTRNSNCQWCFKSPSFRHYFWCYFPWCTWFLAYVKLSFLLLSPFFKRNVQ